MRNLKIDYRNPVVVRKSGAGMDALMKEFRPIGAVYSLRLISYRCGNYTIEREQLFDGIQFEETASDIRALDNRTTE